MYEDEFGGLIQGQFYEFTRGQTPSEVGYLISRKDAQFRLHDRLDVYTPMSSDAKSLAKDVQKGKADWEGSHQPGYYPHYHPAGNHRDYGHVFYGDKGYRVKEHRRS